MKLFLNWTTDSTEFIGKKMFYGVNVILSKLF